MGSLLSVLKYNQDRKATNVRVFELGRVFLRDDTAIDSDTTVKGLHQPLRVAGLASGDAQPAQWGVNARAVDFFDVRADVEAMFAPRKLIFKPEPHPVLHPGRSARVYLGDSSVDGVAVGYVGELHPKWKQTYGLALAPVLFELDLSAVLARDLPKLEAVPKTPFVQRDLAVVVQESVTHAALMDAIHSTPLDAVSKGLLRGAMLFDIYRAKTADTSMAQGEKSLAVRLTLGSDEQTLTDAQIEVITSAITAQLTAQLNARLR